MIFNILHIFLVWNTTWNSLGCNVTCDNGTERFQRNCIDSDGLPTDASFCEAALPNEIPGEFKYETCVKPSCAGECNST